MSNLNFQLIPAEVLEEASVKLNEVNQLLKPYLISLTVDQRVKMSKMGDKTYSFVVKSLEYAKQTPNLVPSYVDMEGFFIDLQNVNACKQISIPVANLNAMLDDTMMQAGHEAYESALAFYNAVKIAAKNNVPGAKVIYDDLSQRFARLGTKNGNGETEK